MAQTASTVLATTLAQAHRLGLSPGVAWRPLRDRTLPILHKAIEANDTATVRRLAKGFGPEILNAAMPVPEDEGRRTSFTALGTALHAGSRGAGKFSRKPLSRATVGEMVNLLLDLGADPRVPANSSGSLPLGLVTLAAPPGAEALVGRMIELGADPGLNDHRKGSHPDTEDPSEMTP